MNNNKSDAYKLSIVGEAGVGKSSIVERIVRDRFLTSDNSTIGAAFSTYKYNNESYQIWDTAGQERYQALIPMYLRNSKIVIIVYDVTNVYSIQRVRDHWHDFVKNNVDDDCYVMLIGNKSDKRGRNAKDLETVENIAMDMVNEYRLPFQKVSAKNCLNMQNIFKTIDIFIQAAKLERIAKRYDDDESGGNVLIDWDTFTTRPNTGIVSACTGDRCLIG